MSSSVSNKKLREFGLLIGFLFPILIGWILPAISGHIFRSWTLLVGIPSITFGILKPRLLLYPYKRWLALGHALGWVNSHLILGIVYFLVLLPIAFIMRLIGYDPLKKRWTSDYSYREKTKKYTSDLTRIF